MCARDVHEGSKEKKNEREKKRRDKKEIVKTLRMCSMPTGIALWNKYCLPQYVPLAILEYLSYQ